MKHLKTSTLSKFLVGAMLLIFIESAFFEDGSIILALLGVALIYVSIHKRIRFLFWTGILLIILALLSMWSLRILILVTLVYILLKLHRGEEVHFSIPSKSSEVKKEPSTYISSQFFSVQTTPIDAYEWQDIHVQGLVGDMTVDTTQTLLPKGTSFISIRQCFGKVRVAVPYGIPVRVHYSTFVGDANIFGQQHMRLWNKTLYQKDGYETDQQSNTELIISISTWLGDVEVIRK